MKSTIFRRSLCLLIGLAFVAPGTAQAENEDQQQRSIPIALIQFESQPGRSHANHESINKLTRHAVKNGARWVLFHELSLTDHTAVESVPSGPMCRKMIELAKELNCFISFGVAERDGQKVYITQVFVGPKGFIYRYRKTWLWEPLGEWRWYDPGTGPEQFTFDGVVATCFICSDGVSQRCLSQAAALKPQVIFYPNSRPGKLPLRDYGKWAKQIGAPLLFVNRAGGKYLGSSGVFDADRSTLAQANTDSEEEILLYTLELPAMNRTRSSSP